MDEKFPPSRAIGTRAPDPESEYSRFLKVLAKIREIRRLTAELGARPPPTSGAERRGPATRSVRGPSIEPLDIPCPAGIADSTTVTSRGYARHSSLRRLRGQALPCCKRPSE